MVRLAIWAGIGVAAIAFAMSACGSDETTVVAQNATSTVSSASGGAGGDSSTTTGAAGAGGDSDCPHEGPDVIDPSTLEPCAPACDGAHCVPESLVPPEQQSLLATCTTGGNAGFCVPDVLIKTAGNFIPATCTSVAGAEGRCISECLPEVQAQAVVLPQAGCATGERCVPCFDPFTQEDTGACTISCDPGPQEPPVELMCPYNGPEVIDPDMLPACEPACNGAHCLPAAFLPAPLQSQLAPCTGGFCTPDSFIAGGGQSLPATCTSVAGAEGRCLSTCLPDIAAQAPFLPQSTCGTDERCAPCFDPTATDPTLPTGACALACDMAVDPPVVLTCPWTGPPVLDASTLPACSPACGGAHCLPAALVPPSQQSQLATCPGGYCVPDPIIETAGNNLPTTCTAFPNTNAEGRCLSDCLPQVAAQLSSLQQDICASGEHCVPCYDPFTGMPTGACSSSPCDAPANAPYTFPTCCPFNNMDQGTCVPTAMVPQAQQGDLLQLTCPSNLLCVPNEYLPNSTIPIPSCSSFLGTGACVSECTNLPLSFPQGSCPGNHVCVPCLFGPPGCP